ncbi:MAG: hypothetical protein ACFFD8_05865 [Candidatus Thorarchaeota archaeon]
MVSLLIRVSWVKSTWLVVFLVLVLSVPFFIYENSPIQIPDAETSSEALSTPLHTSSLTESMPPYSTPDLVKFPAPSIPAFESVGINFTATQYIETMDSAYVTTGIWGDNPYERVDTHNKTITYSQPAEGTISHMACSVDNVYGYDERIGLVPNGDFEDYPYTDGGGYWHTSTGGTGNPLCIHGWKFPTPPPLESPGWLTMTVASSFTDIAHSSRGEIRSWVDTSPLPAGEYVRAFLHFDLTVVEQVFPFTYVEETEVRLKFDGSTIWHRDYGRIDGGLDGEQRGHDYDNVYVDVTDRIGSGGSFEIQLYCISTTSCTLIASSHVTTSWSDIKLFVTEKIPISSTSVYIEDSDTSQKHYFDSQGLVDFSTMATAWEFGPDPHHYMDANWTITATVFETKNMTSSFSVAVDAPFVSWEILSPSSSVPTTPEWIHARYESLFPLTWTYNQSEAGIGSHWEDTLHMLSYYTNGWHQFLSPNDAIAEILVAMQNHTQIIRSPCYHFMRGEQYAVSASGIIGSYFLDVYNPNAYHESGNGWKQSNEMWKHNNTGQIFSLSPNTPLGNYAAVVKCLGPDPLDQVGYSSTTFSVSEYHIASLQSEITSEGNVIVAGQLGSADSGEYTVYCVRAIQQTPAIAGRFDRVVGDMRLQDWYQTDCLLSATGEPIDIHFTVNNTGLQKVNVLVSLRFLSFVSRSYVLFEKTSVVSTWEANQLQEFNWPNLWIGPVGNNTMMRRGFYFMELEINGNRVGLQGGAIGSYLAVTDSPSMNGKVPDYRSIPVLYPDFSTEFVRLYGHLATPITNYFLVTVMDVNHITADSIPVCSETLKLRTSLHQPHFANYSLSGLTGVHPNGSISAEAWLWSESPHLTDYAFSNYEFFLDYYVNWSTEYEFWGSASFHNRASPGDLHGLSCLTIDDPEGHLPGSYPLLVRYQGDAFTHSCNLTGTVEYAATRITTPVPGPGTSANFGGRGSLSARLLGFTCGMSVSWANPGFSPLSGRELIFTIFNGINWQVIGVGVTDSDGWAQIFYTANFVPGAHQVRVFFDGYGFFEGSVADYTVTISPSVLFIGIAIPTIVIPIVISVFVIRKRRTRGIEGGEVV